LLLFLYLFFLLLCGHKTIQSAADHSPTAVASDDFHYPLDGQGYTYD
jgi:hypothetical protein